MELNYHPELRIVELAEGRYYSTPGPFQRPGYGSEGTINHMHSCITEIIREEERKDIQINLADMICRNDGVIYTSSHMPMPIEGAAFHQLMIRLAAAITDSPRGMPGYVTTCPPDIRSENFMYWIEHINARGIHPSIVLRTRFSHSQRAIFAVVTPSYTACDCDYIADVAREVLKDSEMTGFGLYDGSDFKINLHRNGENRDGLRSGLEIRTSDDGGGSIFINHVIFDELNTSYVQLAKFLAPNIRKVHRGSHELMEDTIEGALNQIDEVQMTFFNHLERAKTDQVATSASEIKRIIQRLTADRAVINGRMTRITPTLKATGVSQDTLVSLIYNHWSPSEGFTRASIFRATLHATQRTNFPSEYSRVELESRVSELLRPELQLIPSEATDE